MAIVHCPECGKQISDQAKTCPNCGYPMAQKSIRKSGKFAWIMTLNIFGIVFGFVFIYAVLQSTNGPSGNANAAALGWFLTVGGILSSIAIKRMNKSLFIFSNIFYFAVFIIAYVSIEIATAYILPQLFSSIVTITNLHFMKKYMG